LEELVRSHKLKNIEFLGYIKDPQRISEYAACCFSLACPGTAGLALTQAQSIGLPFLFCPDEENGPEIEIAEPGFNCLQFSFNNAVSLAQGLGLMHGERALWLERSQAYAKKISTRYTVEAMAATFADFFRRPRRAA
jgi:glycosyltransferase involved in cell wall biosynthesis